MRHRPARAVTAAVAVLVITACTSDTDVPAATGPPTTELSGAASTVVPSASTTEPASTTLAPSSTPLPTGAALVTTFTPRLDEALAAEFAASPELRGYIVHLRSDDGFTWSGVAGDADLTSSLRIASVTKMFTAAATLRLVEQGRFALDDPIRGVLAPGTVDLLVGAGYDPDAITVAHLLTHTAGLVDVTFDPRLDFVGQVLADPQRRWTRREQVELAMQVPPLSEPGEQFSYTDTGYALLGEIVEEATGATLGASFRDLLRFDELGIEHTYQESIDPVPATQPARLHQWWGDVDTYDWDPSLDLYGGGGLVSTAADLATFIEALLSGRVYDDEATLDAMLTVPGSNIAPGAGAGIFRRDVAGQECWGHEGFWGVLVLRCPGIGLTVVSSRSQAAPPPTFTGAELGAVVLDLVAALAA